MKIMFVVNPISGGVDKEPFLKSATAFCKKYGIDYHIFKTTGKNDDQEMKKELLEYDPDKVASVGGDGTTLFTATNLMGTSPIARMQDGQQLLTLLHDFCHHECLGMHHAWEL